MNKKKGISIVAILMVIIAIIAVIFVVNRRTYKSVAKDFAKAMQSEEKMNKFVEKNFDFKAMYAIEKIGEDDDIDKEDQKELAKAFKKEYKKVKKDDYEDYKDKMKDVMQEFVTEDNKIKLKNVEKPEKFDEFELLDKCEATYEDEDGKEVKLDLYLYKNKIVLIDTNDVITGSIQQAEIATNNLSQQEIDMYNAGVKPYIGESVKGSGVKVMIDTIISQNESNVSQEGKFISLEANDITGYDGEDLEDACKDANLQDGGDNTKENVAAATKEMNKLKSRISAAKNYTVSANYEEGVIWKVIIEEK